MQASQQKVYEKHGVAIALRSNNFDVGFNQKFFWLEQAAVPASVGVGTPIFVSCAGTLQAYEIVQMYADGKERPWVGPAALKNSKTKFSCVLS